MSKSMNARFYAPLSKLEKRHDGTLRVSGIASSESVDEAGEIIKASAMEEALPAFFKFGTGALRVMHQPIAAGTVDEADVDSGVTTIIATVVDADSINKIEKGVLKGFSIGGKVLERDKKNKKIITKIALYEISLVDRPCNPEAHLDVWKAAGALASAGPTADQIGKVLAEMSEEDRVLTLIKAARKLPLSRYR